MSKGISSLDYEVCTDSETLCPYCHFREQYSGDSLGDDEETEEVCSNCKKTFLVVAHVSKDHQCYKIEEEE